MQALFGQLLIGLINGSFYAMLSLGLAVIFGLLNIINFTHGAQYMRIVDIQLSFPAILIALILIAVLGQGTGKVIAALVTVQWAYYARTVRGAALVEKRKEYMNEETLAPNAGYAKLEIDLARMLAAVRDHIKAAIGQAT